MDPALLHRIDEELARIGFAVFGDTGISKIMGEGKRIPPLWEPGNRLLRIVESFAPNTQAEIVALRSFGCGYDAVSMQQAHDAAMRLQRPFTELKIDDIVDTAHIRIRLRTLAYTSGLGSSAKPPHVSHAMNTGEMMNASATPDLCSTVKTLAEWSAAEYDRQHQRRARIPVPEVCKRCLQDSLAFELKHMRPESCCEIHPGDTLGSGRAGAIDAGPNKNEHPKVGLLGNPLLVFDENENEHIAELLKELGCIVVLPRPELIAVEDVRYFEQLDLYRTQGVDRIIYLQSFGCLKGHIHARGSLRELERRYPDMPITVIDYDPESSALNRENRIRLAVSMK